MSPRDRRCRSRLAPSGDNLVLHKIIGITTAPKRAELVRDLRPVSDHICAEMFQGTNSQSPKPSASDLLCPPLATRRISW